MVQIKSDPDGTPKTAETSGLGQPIYPVNPPPPPPVVSVVETSSLRAALIISPDGYQSIRIKPNRSLRPIAPKPSTSSPQNAIPSIAPNRYGPVNSVADDAGFVSFGGFERHFVSNNGHRIPRAEYANAIVPHKHLNVFGRNTLRLYQIVPKSRTMGFSAFGTKNPTPHYNQSAFVRAQQDDMFTQPNMSRLSCSHQTIRSKRLDSSASSQIVKPSTSKSPTDHETAPPETDQSPDRSDCTSDFVLNVNRLRPSVQLLTRIGRQLVQSQYKYLTTDECGCGAIRHLDDTDGNHDEDEMSDDVDFDSLLAECESSHLVWREKPANARWNRVRALCESQRCPFVPATIFQLHRHLEQGHQKLVRYAWKTKPKSTTSSHELSCDFAIPLVMIPHIRIPVKIKCPVCPDFSGTSNTVISHISHAHPFISASLLCKSIRHYCGICGVVVPHSTSCRVTNTTTFGSLIHTACNPSPNTARHAAWANCDAHSLACLMLNPNRHSRLSMSELMVRHLYQSMDYVLSVNVGRLHLWSIDSCSLRCSLAVSSLFGELIRVPLHKQSALIYRAEALESNPSDLESSHTAPSDSFKPNDSTEASTSSPVAANPPTPVVLAQTQEPPPQPASGSVSQNAEVSTATELPIPTRKRTHNSSESSSVESVEPEKKYAKVSNIESAQIINRVEPCQTIMVDLTNGHADEDRPDGFGLVPITPPKAPQPGQSKIPGLQHPLFRQPPDETEKPAGACVPRMNRALQEACELCGLCVRSSRQHLLESHSRQVGSTPTEFCLCCGRLFWTDEGCDIHQNLKCPVCSSEVCHATMFMHLTAAHRDYFLHLLETRPLDCPVCHRKFADFLRFLSHARMVHQCLLPREICNDLSRVLPAFTIHPSWRGARLSQLTLLHTQCKQSLRKRNAAPTLVPSNIVSYDTSCMKLPLYSCSVCGSSFVSVTHLDFHVMLIGHQYWCASCQFACLTAADLIAHDSACHVLKAVNCAQFRLIRPPGSTNGLHPAVSKIIPSMAGSVVTAGATTVLRQPQPSVTGQLHSCNMCPVFCLTLEDLNLHRLTAHKLRPLTNQSKNGPVHPTPLISATTGAPTTVLVTTCADPVSSTVLHYRPPANDTPVQRTRLLLTNASAGAGLNALYNLRPPIVVRPTSCSLMQPTFTVSVRAPSASSATTSGVLRTADPDAADLTCPMCEFQSKNRAEVMQHIVDAH